MLATRSGCKAQEQRPHALHSEIAFNYFNDEKFFRGSGPQKICLAVITLQIFTIFFYITGTTMTSRILSVVFKELSLIWSLSKFIFGHGGLRYASDEK